MEFVYYQSKCVETMLGPIGPEQAHFHCAPWHTGFVLFDRQLGLGANSLSASLEEPLCLLSARISFREAVELLAHLTFIGIDDNTAKTVALPVTDFVERQEALMEGVTLGLWGFQTSSLERLANLPGKLAMQDVAEQAQTCQS